MKTKPDSLSLSVRVGKDELTHFAEELLCKAGVVHQEASIVAKALVWSDERRRHPQGVSRIPNFVQRVQRKLIVSPAPMRWVKSVTAVGILDAANGLGHVAGVAAMKRAIELARLNGVGVTAVRHSNLYGAAAYFCSLAAEENCIGFSCTNAVPKVAPFGAIRPVFGTNPLAFGCPTASGVPILVDMSTSAIAGSSARSLEETGKRLPEGVALDKHGVPTTNPKDLSEGTLLPAAGPKGFGLGLMVEIFCGILAGAAMGKEVGSMYHTWDRPANTGHFFIVLDIETFLPKENFFDRISTMIGWMKSAAPDGTTIRYPGEIRGEYAADTERNGIQLPAESVVSLTKLADELHVEYPWQLETNS